MGSAYVNARSEISRRSFSAAARGWPLDLACFGTSLVCAGLVAWLAAAPFLGHVPDQNAFFSADTGRVYAYLSGLTEGYYRMKVHPLYGWTCIFYQFVCIKLLHLPPWFAVPAFSAAIGVTCSGLLYGVMRRLRVPPLTAASFVLLFCSSATYVFWSSLPETHLLAGASVLVAVLLLTSRDGPVGKTWKSVAALVAGFSMVVTDGMVWVLRQVDYASLRRGDIRTFVRDNLARFRPSAKIAIWGVALTYLFWAPEWLILGKRVGIPFNFLEERNYVELHPSESALSIHIFGLTPPGIAFDWLVPALCAGATMASLLVIRPQQWFIPLFALFGLMLHLVYSGDCAFLFSPDYMPLFIVTLALVAKERLPAWTPAVVASLAAALLICNLQLWHGQMQAVAASGQMKTFDTVTLH